MNIGTVGQVEVSGIYRGQGFGAPAQLLLQNNMDVESLRTNDETLLHEEWLRLDAAVIEDARTRLRVLSDMQAAGCVEDLGDSGLASTVLGYQKESKAGVAGLSMDGLPATPNDQPHYDIAYIPLPIVSCDYTINARFLAESRKMGRPIDTTMAAQASQRVAEKVESILINGASDFTFGGGKLQGLIDFDDAQTASLTAPWNASGTTGDDILDLVLAMLQKQYDAKKVGPFGIYYPWAYESALAADYKANGDKTIRQRVMESGNIKFLSPCESMPSDTVVCVDLNKNSFRVINALSPKNVPWQSHGGLLLHYKVMAIIVPDPRADYTGNSGVVIAS